MTMGFSHPGTILGMLLSKMGSLKTVPFRMLRIVPLGDLYILERLNSLTRCSSGVMVAHLMPTLYLRIACAASIVTWSSVYCTHTNRQRGAADQEEKDEGEQARSVPSCQSADGRSDRVIRETNLFTVLHAQIIVLDVEVDVGQDQLWKGWCKSARALLVCN